MTLTYSLFTKAISDSAGMFRIAGFARRRMVNAVVSLWRPGRRISLEDVEEVLGCKLNEKTARYVDRVKTAIYATESADKSFTKDLFYFSEIARSIEDARQESREAARATEPEGQDG